MWCCSTCDAKFPNLVSYNEHLSTQHHARFTCDWCGAEFDDYQDRLSHPQSCPYAGQNEHYKKHGRRYGTA